MNASDQSLEEPVPPEVSSGALYIVTAHSSDVYLRSTVLSARSLRKNSPQVARGLFTDAAGHKLLANLRDNPFTWTGTIENPHYRSKVDYMPRTPFARTLYLDSDTRVIRPIDDVFRLMDRFDMAMAQAHRRTVRHTGKTWREPLPGAFPQYNSGVIVYSDTEKVRSFLQQWSYHFHQAGEKKDQVTLRELLWKSDLRLATLPPEFNVRRTKYFWMWSKREAQIRILHMRRFHQPLYHRLGI
jgi:hypothetical protein